MTQLMFLANSCSMVNLPKGSRQAVSRPTNSRTAAWIRKIEEGGPFFAYIRYNTGKSQPRKDLCPRLRIVEVDRHSQSSTGQFIQTYLISHERRSRRCRKSSSL